VQSCLKALFGSLESIFRFRNHDGTARHGTTARHQARRHGIRHDGTASGY